MENVVVSVFCLAYNHGNYIREAIEGMLMQKTKFAFEILIHEDASTDNTADILREYERKYPQIIKVVYEEKNRYKTGVDYFYDILLPLAHGKYIACCECDDAWIDEYKLQMQIDYMEQHPECTLTGHKAFLQYPHNWNKEREKRSMGFEFEGIVPYERIFKEWSIPTASFVFKRDIYEKMPRFFMEAPTGDEPILFYMASEGYVYFFDRVMSVYNKGASDSWTSNFMKSEYDVIVNYYVGYFELFENVNKYTDYIRNDFFTECIKDKINKAVEYLLYNTENCEDVIQKLNELADKSPEKWKTYITNQSKRFWFTKKDNMDSFFSTKKENRIFVYGAGGLANKFFVEILPEDISVYGVLVSDGRKDKIFFRNVPIFELSQVNLEEDDLVIVAVNKDHSMELIGELEKKKHYNYLWIYETVFEIDVLDSLPRYKFIKELENNNN